MDGARPQQPAQTRREPERRQHNDQRQCGPGHHGQPLSDAVVLSHQHDRGNDSAGPGQERSSQGHQGDAHVLGHAAQEIDPPKHVQRDEEQEHAPGHHQALQADRQVADQRVAEQREPRKDGPGHDN